MLLVLSSKRNAGSTGMTKASCQDHRGGTYDITNQSFTLEAGHEAEFVQILLPEGDQVLRIQCILTTLVMSDGITDPDPNNNKVTASDFRFLVKK